MSLLQTAIAAANAAADAIRAARTSPLEVKSKGYRDVVTAADFAAERAITGVIRAAYPDAAILSEEDPTLNLGTWTPPPGELWIIDPLDGTTNFSRGIPAYSTSIGVMVDGAFHIGVIEDPTRDMCFVAERGKGMTLNGEPVRVSERADFAEAVMACDWPRATGARVSIIDIAMRMLPACRTLRVHGSAALNLAYVAAGFYEAYFHSQLNPWDLAAGVLMVEEAGGKVTALGGGPFDMVDGGVIASNGLVHEAVLAEVRAAL